MIVKFIKFSAAKFMLQFVTLYLTISISAIATGCYVLNLWFLLFLCKVTLYSCSFCFTFYWQCFMHWRHWWESIHSWYQSDFKGRIFNRSITRWSPHWIQGWSPDCSRWKSKHWRVFISCWSHIHWWANKTKWYVLC